MAVGRLVRITVVTSDPQIIELSQGALRDLGERSQLSTSLDPSEPCDICIWDCVPGISVSLAEGSERKDLYLVDSNDLPAFHETLVRAQGNVLLKPVTRVVLQTFLELALARQRRAALADLGAVRADRDEILQGLLFANLKLQEFDQQRTNFISRAVHDFRAPLTALSGFCGLLIAEQLGPLNPQQKEALQRMQRSADRLQRMSTSMLELGVSRHVIRQPNFLDADIRKSIDQAIHELQPIASEKQIAISVGSFVEPVGLYFEPSQIEQVLINLLENACKVTPAGGVVEIYGYPYMWERRFVQRTNVDERRAQQTTTPNSFRIDVKDVGPGVPKEQLGKIFEEYATHSSSNNGYGSGLGLAICKLIVHRHGGEIWADNSQKGAVFSMVLPCRPKVENSSEIARKTPASVIKTAADRRM